jgi:2-isopropylmalate synthase
MSKKIKIFDTTLRDGEQVPGSRLNAGEKVEIAKSLEELGVDIMEVGFPISSPGDLKSVKEVSSVVKNSVVCALARGVEVDIDTAYDAVKSAVAPRIHTFLPVSHLQMEHVLKKTPQDVLHLIDRSIRYAKKYVDDVEWSGMDASRADRDFLLLACQTAIDAGATTINMPDTVGSSVPKEYGGLIKYLYENTPKILDDQVVLSVHVHNDLGLATANSLSGVLNGATQVECTINGIGERAGNSALEEIVMILKTKYGGVYHTQIDTVKITSISMQVAQMMNMTVQKNKAIVGANAFAHSSGIHQDGIIKKRESFEAIDPSIVGSTGTSFVLTSRSGRSALRHRLEMMGHKLDKSALDRVYTDFLRLADIKKEITDEDLKLVIYSIFKQNIDE